MDEPGNGSRVSRTDLLSAIASIRDEVQASERRLTARMESIDSRNGGPEAQARRIERLESMERTVKDHGSRIDEAESIIDQLRGAKTLLIAVIGSSVVSAVASILALLSVLR